VIDINTILLDSLPPTEADELEYKSSLTSDSELKREIQNATSAFWNSGGGVFLAGVNDNGIVDGGVSTVVGRQSREDWVANVISGVNPPATYSVRLFDDSCSAKIDKGKCVLGVQFGESASYPHQSPDSRYYIRAGAHTVPAPHFVVEALYAKRHFRNPRLLHFANISYFIPEVSILHVELVAATDAPALGVEVDFAPRPVVSVQGEEKVSISLPITVPLIDRDHPFEFRFSIRTEPVYQSTIKVKYRDIANNFYSYEDLVDVNRCLAPRHRKGNESAEIVQELRELREIRRALERK
jgi:hypothetical protein